MSRLILPEHLRRDRFFMQKPGKIAEVSMKILNVLQDESPETQVSACGLLFRAMCTSIGVDPREVFTLLERMQADIQRTMEARGAEEYVVQEIANVEKPSDLERQIKEEIEKAGGIATHTESKEGSEL